MSLTNQTMMILVTVITDAGDKKRTKLEKESNQTVRNFNGKIADDSV